MNDTLKPAHDPQAHLRFWPEGVPRRIDVPDESLCTGLQARAAQTPHDVGLDYLGCTYTWQQLLQSAEHLAGGLQALGVQKGQRVILFMQNCPQFIIAFHAVIRLGAVVVPVNPMNKADELGHYILDAEAHVAIASSDIAPELARASQMPEAGQALQHLVVFDLAEALPEDHVQQVLQWPAVWQNWLPVRHALPQVADLQLHAWQAVLDRQLQPSAVSVRGDDLALLPYTSGTTGVAKGVLPHARHVVAQRAGRSALAGHAHRRCHADRGAHVPYHRVGDGHAGFCAPWLPPGVAAALGPPASCQGHPEAPRHALAQHPDHGDRPAGRSGLAVV